MDCKMRMPRCSRKCVALMYYTTFALAIFTIISVLFCVLLDKEQSGSVAFFLWPRFVSNIVRTDKTKRRQVTILMWTTFFNYKFDNAVFKLCPKIRCKISHNRRLFNVSDAVVFHDRDLNLMDMPRVRGYNQHFVFFLLESPYHTSSEPFNNLSQNFYTLTMSYRRDADIKYPFGWFRNRSQPLPDGFLEHFVRPVVEGRRKLVAWFVSNCQTPSKREAYVKKLSQYIQVDIYGACGNLKCSKSDDKCFSTILAKNYKFYIAMENSVCMDYVTEKYFDRLPYFVIPIVFRRGIYTAVGPNDSFIAADDFPNPKALADYLLTLANDTDAYMKYFEWMRYQEPVGIVDRDSYGFCNLCRYLHKKHPAELVIPSASASNVHDWYKGQAKCQRHYGELL